MLAIVSKADHRQIFYFDNIAEISDKMSEGEKAYERAKEVKRQDSNTAIINTLLAKYKNKENLSPEQY